MESGATPMPMRPRVWGVGGVRSSVGAVVEGRFVALEAIGAGDLAADAIRGAVTSFKPANPLQHRMNDGAE